jgi:hypothetical protein
VLVAQQRVPWASDLLSEGWGRKDAADRRRAARDGWGWREPRSDARTAWAGGAERSVRSGPLSFFWGVLRRTPQTPRSLRPSESGFARRPLPVTCCSRRSRPRSPSLRGSESRFAPRPWLVADEIVRPQKPRSRRASESGFTRRPLSVAMPRRAVHCSPPLRGSESRSAPRSWLVAALRRAPHHTLLADRWSTGVDGRGLARTEYGAQNRRGGP